MYISQNLRQSWYGNMLGSEENEEDQDTMKVDQIFQHFKKSFRIDFQRALVETNPYLLVVTIVVSIIHTVFEMLAFKNGRYTFLLHNKVAFKILIRSDLLD